MGRVVVAVTGAEVDVHALQEALALLGPGHTYTFLTVDQGVVPVLVAEGNIGGPVVLEDGHAWDETYSESRAPGDQTIRRMMQQLAVEGSVRTESGDPGERICAVALEEEADLIVMGSHHAGALRRLLGGSVADDVTHHAPCPVLLVRHGDG